MIIINIRFQEVTGELGTIQVLYNLHIFITETKGDFSTEVGGW